MTAKCASIQEQLLDYLNRRLAPEENSEIVRHLASCPVCRAETADLLHLREIAQKLAPVMPQGVRQCAFQEIFQKEKNSSLLKELAKSLEPAKDSLLLVKQIVRLAI